MVFFIALIQAAPLFVIGHFSRSKAAITATLIVMLVIAGATGRGAYFVVDAIVLLIAYFIALNMFSAAKKEDVPVTAPLPKPSDHDREVLLGGIESTAEAIMREEGRTQHDAQFLAIVAFLDDLQNRPNGQAGARLMVDIARNEYSQHFNEVLMYLGWRDGKLFLKPEVERRLKERLQKKNA